MKVKFNYYLKKNKFNKNANIILKYLRRYDIDIFNDKIQKFKKITNKKSIEKKRPLYNFENSKTDPLKNIKF